MEPGRVLVLLGGGRGNWPNFWSVLAYRPGRVYLLPPQGDAANTRYTEEWLSGRVSGSGCPASGRPACETLPAVPPYEAAAAREACAALLRRHAGETVLLNVTQAPKPMAIGACQAAWTAGGAPAGESRAVPFYLDTARGAVHAFGGRLPDPGSGSPALEDYLAAYGRACREKFASAAPGPDERELSGSAAALARTPGLPGLLRALRQGETGRPQEVLLADPRPAWGRTLGRLHRAGLLASLAWEGGSIRLAYASERARAFLNGTWLELYARDAARACAAGGKPLFCDCRFSLLIPNHATEAEVDLACLDPHGMLLYASCKTGADPFRKRAPRPGSGEDPATGAGNLNEIVDRAQLLGGGYCVKLLVTSAPRRLMSESFRLQAEERRIEVVCVEDLPELRERIEGGMQRARAGAR